MFFNMANGRKKKTREKKSVKIYLKGSHLVLLASPFVLLFKRLKLCLLAVKQFILLNAPKFFSTSLARNQ